MKFSEQHSCEVELTHCERGVLGKARLTFGGGKAVLAEMTRMAVGTGLGTGLTLDFVTAKSEDGRSFTLCDCTVHGSAIYATYLALGVIAETRITKIDVRYSDISEWFLSRQQIKGEVGDKLEWANPAQHFSVGIKDGAVALTLSSRYIGSRNSVGEDEILNEHVKFRFDSPAGQFDFGTLQDRVLELGSLLSLLIAYPISVVSVEVGIGPGRLHSIYFATFEARERDSKWPFAHDCFLQNEVLDRRWPAVLENFYDDPDRRSLWRRLAGMMRYDGFWEFKFLAYVSLLDSYVCRRLVGFSPTSVPPGRAKLQALRLGLGQITPSLDANAIAEVESVAKQVFSYESATFGDKYRYCLSNTDPNVVKVIDITGADFELIKDVRNAVAHGEHPGLTAREFPYAEQVVRKISLLLTCWSLLDLGLTAADFLTALKRTRSKLRIGVTLNEKQLDRATRSAEFFSVSTAQFQTLSARKDIHTFACFIEGPAGKIEFSDRYMQRWTRWQNDPQRGPTIDFKDLFGVPESAVRYAGKVYIESDFDEIVLHAVCLFDRSKLPPT